jgi:DNA replication factor GINS
MNVSGRQVPNDEALPTFKHLCSMVLKEINSDSLQSLPLDIYHKVTIRIASLRGFSEEKGAEENITHKQIELLSNTIRLLFEARYAKIRGAIRNENSSSKFENGLDRVDYSRLTNEEKFILDGKRETGKRIDMVFTAIQTGRPVVLDKISNILKHKRVPVRLTKSIDQFMGIDMVTYGPYREDDIALLPLENARALIQNGFAEEIQTLGL